MKKTVHDWRAKRYHDAFREHWGVFFLENATIRDLPVGQWATASLVDCSVVERDVELRSCSLCEVPGSLVIVRHRLPYTTALGERKWEIRDMVVSRNDREHPDGFEPPQAWE